VNDRSPVKGKKCLSGNWRYSTMDDMKIAIVYATNSGGTQLAAQIVAETFAKHNLTAEIKEVQGSMPADLKNYDLVILASPSWDYEGLEGEPHPDYRPFMEKFKGEDFSGRKFAVFGLGDSSYTYFCGAVQHLEDFVKSLKGELVTQSLRIDGFYLDQQKSSQQLTDWTESLVTHLNG